VDVHVSSSNTTNTTRPSGSGEIESLFQSVGTITATIHNSGSVEAAEVAQLYLQLPRASTRSLRGVQKIDLGPGELAIVSFNLLRQDLSS
jgi:beta-glucosidase